MRQLSVSILACALLAGAAFADDSQTSPRTSTTDAPDATVDISGGTLAAGVGFVWGHGDLIYQGSKHRFKLSGVSIVDVGASRITASGVVYNLKDIGDFNGNYATVSAGVTVGGGGSAVVLRNEHGVVIKLLSTGEGLRFNLSADGVNIKLRS